MGIRKAVPKDIQAITDLGVESLQQHDYPLRISRNKVFQVARECVSSANNFAWVAVKDGKIQGAVGALVGENLFHERKKCSVVMYYSKIPGDGIAMMRTLKRWVEGRPGIKMTEFVLEMDGDPRIELLLARLGFKPTPPVYLYMRY